MKNSDILSFPCLFFSLKCDILWYSRGTTSKWHCLNKSYFDTFKQQPVCLTCSVTSTRIALCQILSITQIQFWIVFWKFWFLCSNKVVKLAKAESGKTLCSNTIFHAELIAHYRRATKSAKCFQILQLSGWFSVAISSGNAQTFVLEVTFAI